MTPLISIIIPVFNGAKFIDHCYKSLQSQDFHNWEAIFINDGSNDGTYDILTNLASIERRIKVINKSNEGVVVAREVGISVAKGDIVTFLDVDDSLMDNAIDNLVRPFSDPMIDMVIGGFVISRGGRLLKSLSYEADAITGYGCFSEMCVGKLRWQLWAKAYRKSILLQVPMPIGIRSGEDMAVCLLASLKSKMVKVISEIVYDYVQVDTSATHSKKEIAMDALKGAAFVEKHAKVLTGVEIRRDIDSLFMQTLSGALRANPKRSDNIIKKTLKNHFSFAALRRISFFKSVNICLFRFIGVNLAKYIS